VIWVGALVQHTHSLSLRWLLGDSIFCMVLLCSLRKGANPGTALPVLTQFWARLPGYFISNFFGSPPDTQRHLRVCLLGSALWLLTFCGASSQSTQIHLRLLTETPLFFFSKLAYVVTRFVLLCTAGLGVPFSFFCRDFPATPHVEFSLQVPPFDRDSTRSRF